ncbi:MAG: helix-turn-helix transcriptional regulator [Akkermansiaceae bacterium]|nr:helix-turn-helix transcriptional regulator [Armatimonadota bacterium]
MPALFVYLHVQTDDHTVPIPVTLPRFVEVKERHHRPGELAVIPYGWHFVSLCLGPGFDLGRRRGSRYTRAALKRGEASLDPGYEANLWTWEEPVHLVHVNLSWSLLERLALETGKERSDVELCERPALSDPQTLRLLTAIHQEVRESRWADTIATDALGSYLAVHLLRHFNARPLMREEHSAAAGGLGKGAIRRVTEYVQENLHREIRVADMAGVAGISTYHFIRSFKRSVGLSPHQYVLEQRVNRARHWLQHSPAMTVAEVAHRSGFADQTHLSRQVRRVTGMTPSQLRQHLR